MDERHINAWKDSATYAFESVRKRWRENGRDGEPPAVFMTQWLAYYLAQQWNYRMPDGGLFSVKL